MLRTVYKRRNVALGADMEARGGKHETALVTCRSRVHAAMTLTLKVALLTIRTNMITALRTAGHRTAPWEKYIALLAVGVIGA